MYRSRLSICSSVLLSSPSRVRYSSTDTWVLIAVIADFEKTRKVLVLSNKGLRRGDDWRPSLDGATSEHKKAALIRSLGLERLGKYFV